MTRGPTFWIVVLAVAAAGAGFWIEERQQNPSAPDGVAVAGIDDPAPAVVWLDVNGKPTSLADWRGRRVLINFWASWCAPCRREMPLLDAAWQIRRRDAGLVIIGVAEDTAEAVRGALAARPVAYPVVIARPDAPGGSLSFGNTRRVLPYSVLIGKDGRILRRKVGTLSPDELDQWLAP